MLLRLAGYDVGHAGDGGQALRLLAERIMDLLLLDLALPPDGGVRVLEEMRAHRALAAHPSRRDHRPARERSTAATGEQRGDGADDQEPLLTARPPRPHRARPRPPG